MHKYKKYPFDPTKKNHIFLGFGLIIWIFCFLYFTEPLDVNQLTNKEKLIYLPLYGFIGGLAYWLFIPFQSYLFIRYNKEWTIFLELIFSILFLLLSILFVRFYYLYVIMYGEKYPYTLVYFLLNIILPATLVIFPILSIGRYALGKYYEKKVDDKKIEIKGEGNYDGLKIFLNDLICIKSADNYIEVFYESNNELKKSLIRNTISKIDQQFPDLLRTHRSHIINPYHFMEWKIEHGKIFVELSHAISVPISKTYKNEVKKVIDSAT